MVELKFAWRKEKREGLPKKQMSQIVNAMNVNIRILLLITARNVGEG